MGWRWREKKVGVEERFFGGEGRGGGRRSEKGGRCARVKSGGRIGGQKGARFGGKMWKMPMNTLGLWGGAGALKKSRGQKQGRKRGFWAVVKMRF